MSFFLNNTKYDIFIIDEKYLKNYNELVELPLIEIFNKDEILFDFSNVVFECSDPDLKGKNVAINKILIDYGDGTSETLHEILKSKPRFIGNFSEKNWKMVSHTFFTEKKHVYEKDLITSNYPHINITFFNQFNDRYYFSIPYKILYKSFYDDSSSFNLMDANINNNNVSSFTLKERKNNTVLVVSAKNHTIGEIYFSNPSFIVDEADDYFVDDDVLTWNWATLPEIFIEGIETTPIVENSTWSVKFKWREKNITIYKFTLSRRLINSSEEPVFITNDFNKMEYVGVVDKPGLYEYIFDLIGINDKHNTMSIVVNCSSTNPCTIYDHETYGLIHPTSKEEIDEQTENVISNKSFNVSFELPKMGQTLPSLDIYKNLVISAHHTDRFISFDFDILKQKDSLIKENNYYSLKVNTDTIPDGKYTITSRIEDIIGNTGDTISTKRKNDVVMNDFYVSYSIGTFDTSSLKVYNNGNATLVPPNNVISINDSNINIEWKFLEKSNNTNPGNADYFEVTLTRIS